MVADEMLKHKKVSKIFVLTPGSLRLNWLSEYCRVCGVVEPAYLEKYTFITYNYNIIDDLKKYDFNNSLVIIDEVHNLLNGYKNRSKNTTALYEKIMDSNCRVLLLSGTPIIQPNIAMDWQNLSALLDGGRSAGIKHINEIPDVNFTGIVSYYPGDPSQYPDVIIKPIQKTEMTSEQYKVYKDIYDWEERIRRQGPPDQRLFHQNPARYLHEVQQFIKANKYLLSRLISNFFYGNTFIDELKESDTDSDTDEIKDDRLPDKMKNEGGWISLSRHTLAEMSPKFVKLLTNIIKNIDQKHVIYSFYKTRGGVQLIQTLINYCGKKYGIRAEIFSGDVSSKQREKLLDEFNSEQNRGGKLIKVLLVTEAGSEGISVLECNNIHILESSTRENRTRQAIGRVIRYKSHEKLPKAQQFVNVWRYWSVQPASETKKYALVDEELYKNGKNSEKIVDDFTDILIKHSIENK